MARSARFAARRTRAAGRRIGGHTSWSRPVSGLHAGKERPALKARHAKGSPGLPFGVLLLLAAVAPLAGGCADSTGEALQQDVAQLRQDLNALTLSVHRGRGDTEAVLSQVDRRTREANAESSRQMGALSARVDTLSTELTRVSARLDELSQRIETLSRELASRPAPAPSSGGAAPGTAGAPRSSGGPTPQQAYQAA